MFTLIILAIGAVALPMLGTVLLLILFLAFRKPAPKQSFLPSASAFDKQVAIEMLDGVVLQKAKANVVDMIREAVAAPPENPLQSSSSAAVKQPIA